MAYINQMTHPVAMWRFDPAHVIEAYTRCVNFKAPLASFPPDVLRHLSSACGDMAELVDASDLKSLGVIRPGSTPGVPTALSLSSDPSVRIGRPLPLRGRRRTVA